jgi:hypothetical protein
MPCLRSLCAFALLATACFNPSDDDDDGAADTGATSDADDDAATDTVTTTMTSGVSATNPANDDDDDATDPTITATDPSDDTSADDTTGDPTEDTGTTDPGTTTDTGEPAVCNPVGDDCETDEYCDAPDCVTQGVCAPRPAMTSPTMAPACGCNDTSYWNLEHAHWLGATAFETDIAGCGVGTTSCGDGGDCIADGSECVTDHGLGSGSCTNDELGRCWAIPDNADCEGAPAQPEVGFGSCATGPNQCDENYLLLCDALIAGDYFAICL